MIPPKMVAFPESFVPISTSYGCRGTLALPDGLVIAVTYASGVQYEITFR